LNSREKNDSSNREKQQSLEGRRTLGYFGGRKGKSLLVGTPTRPLGGRREKPNFYRLNNFEGQSVTFQNLTNREGQNGGIKSIQVRCTL